MTKPTNQRHLKRCHICGDVALSFNFNGISCESCRNFFRRYAYKHKELKCDYNQNCYIDMKTRRHCQRCRMMKCFSIGMKQELINRRVSTTPHRPNENTLRRLSPPSTPSSCLTSGSPSSSSKPSYSLIPLQRPKVALNLHPDDREFLEAYEEEFIRSFQNLCCIFRTFHPKVVGYAQDVSQVFNMQEYLIQNIVNFSKCIESFQGLDEHDQLLILKTSFTEIIMLRALFYYQSQEDSFPMRIDERAENAVFVRLDLLYQTRLHHLIELHRKLAEIVTEEKEDNLLRDLMAVLIMFKPRGHGVHCPEYIRYEYARYRYLLKRYLLVKYQDTYRANVFYLSLMQIVHDVEELKKNFLEIYTMIDARPVSHSLLEIYEITEEEK